MGKSDIRQAMSNAREVGLRRIRKEVWCVCMRVRQEFGNVCCAHVRINLGVFYGRTSRGRIFANAKHRIMIVRQEGECGGGIEGETFCDKLDSVGSIGGKDNRVVLWGRIEKLEDAVSCSFDQISGQFGGWVGRVRVSIDAVAQKLVLSVKDGAGN